MQVLHPWLVAGSLSRAARVQFESRGKSHPAMGVCPFSTACEAEHLARDGLEYDGKILRRTLANLGITHCFPNCDQVPQLVGTIVEVVQ